MSIYSLQIPESIEPIILYEMLHLPSPIRAVVLGQRRPRGADGADTVRVAPKVEPGHVHAGELELSAGDWDGGGC